jgi:hypothetical protein
LVAAIEDAGRGYSINLVRLVDGEATYELTYRGETTEHPSYSDASDALRKMARVEKVEAATAFLTHSFSPELAGMRKALEEMCGAAEYWAGCAEGCSEDEASSEIMSSGGVWPSMAYNEARQALSTSKGEGQSSAQPAGDDVVERIKQRVEIIRRQDTYSAQVGHATQLGFLVEQHAEPILAALSAGKGEGRG